MQGIYRKTEEIFHQLHQKLAASNETILRLRDFVARHSQAVEGLQARLAQLEQENERLRGCGPGEEALPDERGEPAEWRARVGELEARLAERELRLAGLEQALRETRGHAERLEREILANKVQISEAMNAAFETGEEKLVEFFEKALVSGLAAKTP